MNLADLSTADLAGVLLGFFFTLFIFSYIFGDNALFRLAIHIFIGVAAGYAAVVAWYNVIWPQLLLPIFIGSRSELLFVIIPLILAGLLMAKVSPRLASWGSVTLAYMVGVGVATAIGGAVLGTLFPQIGATINLFDWQTLLSGPNFAVRIVEGGFILLGTITSLIYFQFGARPRANRPPRRLAPVEGVAWVGQLFIAVTLGSLFAGVYVAALTALIERSQFIVTLLSSLIQPR